MQYKFNENTLLHSLAFNPFILESILTNGIVSKKEASLRNIPYARNYFGYNLEDYISMTKKTYTYDNDPTSAYNLYALKGISLAVENQEYIYDRNDMYYNHADEVYVERHVPKENIKGIIIPEKYLDYELSNLPMLHTNSTSYENIKHVCENLLTYLEKYNYKVNKEEYLEIINYLKIVHQALSKEKDDKELLEDYKEIKHELDDFLSEEVNNCFKQVLNKEEVTLYDMVEFINSKTQNLPIYQIKNISRTR